MTDTTTFNLAKDLVFHLQEKWVHRTLSQPEARLLDQAHELWAGNLSLGDVSALKAAYELQFESKAGTSFSEANKLYVLYAYGAIDKVHVYTGDILCDAQPDPDNPSSYRVFIGEFDTVDLLTEIFGYDINDL